jgi:hypothetical protein
MAWKKVVLEADVWTTLVFTKLGSLSAGTNVTLVLLSPCNLTVDHVRCYAKTAPTGTAIIVDINKEGTTIFTTQANRPSIPAGQNKGAKSAAPDVTALAEGDTITLDIDQVGSTTPGADLTVEVRCRQ